MPKEKRTSKTSRHLSKNIVKSNESSEGLKVVWLFDKIDKNGPFAFSPSRTDFLHKEILDKLIAYSSMTWREIRLQTHDNGKSKHHFLNDISKFSKDAQERFKQMNLEEYSDSIFSFALTNKLRVVGLRDREFFHVLWYDPEHNIYPSNK